ncbi:KedN5 family methylcobalamin-dependent radical SAM C-methyltransferase [Streptomyces sp. NPDC001139]
MGTKKKAWIVQQGAWEQPRASMPLAASYLKSFALADPTVKENIDIGIVNFQGGIPLSEMVSSLFSDGVPDVLAFSVLGWNFRAFGSLAETFKQLNPDGWVIYGGNHVANQAIRVFRMHPEVDFIVNGEGEIPFRDLLVAFSEGREKRNLEYIHGISYRDIQGKILTTPSVPRMENLDDIPSPILTGALPLVDDKGEFLYDAALLETNRGCPYKCSFCYWGGAVGQRMRAFSRERLRAELEVLAQLKVETIALCDSNFGMLPIDKEFVDDLIEIKARYGYPKTLETSWAKNKSKIFYEVVRALKKAGLKSNFAISLQTLDTSALQVMNRRNMKLNDWEDLVHWLNGEGITCWAELIWGAPGETVESFYRGYDKVSEHISRIAVYPLLLLPNTEYSDAREKYGFITTRGDDNDFEYILSSSTISREENDALYRFMFWARLLPGNGLFRFIWSPLRQLAGITQSSVLRSIDEWINNESGADTETLKSFLSKAAVNQDAAAPALRYVFGAKDATRILERWWEEAIKPQLPAEHSAVLNEIFRYELLTLPQTAMDRGLPTVEVSGEVFSVLNEVQFICDVPKVVSAIKRGKSYDHLVKDYIADIFFKSGFEDSMSTDHFLPSRFCGKLERQVRVRA